jgi:hypothetical protein
MPEQKPEDDWADQDLLTRRDAADRLRGLVRKLEVDLAELPPDDAAVGRIRARIDALESAARDFEEGWKRP